MQEKQETHAECNISDLDIFTPAFVQTDILKGRFEDVFPLSNIEDGGPLEFSINNTSEKFLDLANSYLKLSFRVMKADGSELDADAKVTVANYSIASIFSQLDIILNGKNISSSTNLYPYRAMFETLMNYGKDTLKSQLEMGLFMLDGHTKEVARVTTNKGLKKRFELTDKSEIVHVLGRLHSDLFHQGRLILNGLPLRIKLHRSKDSFCLLSVEANADYKLKIVDAVFCVRKVELTPTKFQEIQQVLEGRRVVYPINRVVLKTHSLSAGLTNATWENAILGQLPNRIILALVDNDACSGVYTKNPFFFQHFNAAQVGVYLNGVSLPRDPIRMDFSKRDYIQAYHSLLSASGKLYRDESMGLDIDSFANGCTLFGFDCTPSLCNGAHQEIKKQGNVRIVLDFAEALPRTVTLLMYLDFDNVISVDRMRNVLLDY